MKNDLPTKTIAPRPFICDHTCACTGNLIYLHPQPYSASPAIDSIAPSTTVPFHPGGSRARSFWTICNLGSPWVYVMIFIGCTIRLRLFPHLCIYCPNIGGLYQCTTTDFRSVFLQYHNLKTNIVAPTAIARIYLHIIISGFSLGLCQTGQVLG